MQEAVQSSANQCKAVQSSAKQCKAVQSSAKQCKAVQSSAKQCKAVQSSAKQCKAVQSSAKQCKAVQSSAKQCKAVQSSAKQCKAVQSSAKQCKAVPWYAHLKQRCAGHDSQQQPTRKALLQFRSSSQKDVPVSQSCTIHVCSKTINPYKTTTVPLDHRNTGRATLISHPPPHPTQRLPTPQRIRQRHIYLQHP